MDLPLFSLKVWVLIEGFGEDFSLFRWTVTGLQARDVQRDSDSLEEG